MSRRNPNAKIGIYKIENKINGKIYIGQSVDIKKRWSRHKRSAKNELEEKYPIHYAILKYGLDNFSFDVVEECDVSVIDERELYYISFYDSMIPKGYNCDSGGKSGGYLPKERIDKMSGVESSLSTRLKMSEIQSGGKNNKARKVKDNQGRVWATVVECEKDLGISHLSNMISGVRGWTKKSKPYELQYANEDEEVTEVVYDDPNKLECINVYRGEAKAYIDNCGNVWRTKKDVMDFFEISSKTINSHFKGKRTMISDYLDSICLREMTEEECIKYDKYIRPEKNRGKNRRIIDGDGTIYNSIKHCSKELGIRYLRGFLCGLSPWPECFKDLNIRYYDEPIEENNDNSIGAPINLFSLIAAEAIEAVKEITKPTPQKTSKINSLFT